VLEQLAVQALVLQEGNQGALLLLVSLGALLLAPRLLLDCKVWKQQGQEQQMRLLVVVVGSISGVGCHKGVARDLKRVVAAATAIQQQVDHPGAMAEANSSSNSSSS
jgi:hypothetical protein